MLANAPFGEPLDTLSRKSSISDAGDHRSRSPQPTSVRHAGGDLTGESFQARAAGAGGFSLAQVRHGPRRHRQFHFIDIAPGPAFAWLEGCHHRVARVVEMMCGVPARRTIATADVATTQAEPEMNPGRAQFQALFTTQCVSRNRIEIGQVLTAHIGTPRGECFAHSTAPRRSIESACRPSNRIQQNGRSQSGATNHQPVRP
jgi:hypothetical protein